MTRFETRAAMSGAGRPGDGDICYLSEANVGGWFKFVSTVGAAVIATDPSQALYVPITGASGAWVRERTAGVVSAEWFGMIGDGLLKKDGVVSSTSLSSASSTFTSADVGKTVQIMRAGTSGNTAFTTTISRVVSATQVTLAAAVTTNIASAAVFDYGTDNTTAFQAVITYASIAGAKVEFGAGYFGFVNVTLPAYTGTTGGWKVVQLEGVASPSSTYGTAGSFGLSSSGTVLKSWATNGASAIAIGGSGFSNYVLVIRNVNGRLADNPNNAWLDSSLTQQLIVENVSVDTSVYSVLATQPTRSAGYGIKTPVNANGALTFFRNVSISGMYVALQAGEHFNGDEVNLNGNLVGVEIQHSDHSIHFGRLMTQNCVTGIKFIGGATYFSIDQLDVEHAPTGWQVTTNDIDDASNYGHGNVKWSVVLGGTGQDATFTINGGSNIVASRVGS